MNGAELRLALNQRKRVYGTLVVSPSAKWVPVVAALGVDYIFIDTEHVALDRAQLAWMCQAYAQAGIAPVVRIPSPDPYEACQALDGGAQGIIAPYVETMAEVKALVGAVKYKPLKGQLLEAMLAGEAGEPRTLAYLAEKNREISLIINIESVPALQNLDALLSVPGLDGVLVGPHDLSVSLGVPEEWTAPCFVEAVDRIVLAAKAHGLSAGIHVIYPNGLDQTRRWAELGANLILHQADLLAFKHYMQREFAQLRLALGDAAGSRIVDTNI